MFQKRFSIVLVALKRLSLFRHIKSWFSVIDEFPFLPFFSHILFFLSEKFILHALRSLLRLERDRDLLLQLLRRSFFDEIFQLLLVDDLGRRRSRRRDFVHIFYRIRAGTFRWRWFVVLVLVVLVPVLGFFHESALTFLQPRLRRVSFLTIISAGSILTVLVV